MIIPMDQEAPHQMTFDELFSPDAGKVSDKCLTCARRFKTDTCLIFKKCKPNGCEFWKEFEKDYGGK